MVPNRATYHIWEKYKNILNESYAKLINHLFKMKELDQMVSKKGSSLQ